MAEAQVLMDGRLRAGDRRWQRRLFSIIFQMGTPEGRAFDLALISAILISVAVVMLQSVARIEARHGEMLFRLEWFFTILFSIEYVLRLACVRNRATYATSFYGTVDLLAILPAYMELLLAGSSYLIVIRMLRILRLFRVMKLGRYINAANSLTEALYRSRNKIVVFLYAVLTLVIVFGALMFLIEGPENGFTSIPRGIYWAIVTLTTVGYGDITPRTVPGQAISAMVMILGYGIIAVPTGIYAAELRESMVRHRLQVLCPDCNAVGHAEDASHCKYCGGRLKPPEIEDEDATTG
jgi:voltage-gated potassium channel